MFGKNVKSPVLNNSRELFVNSIFYTLQGEGPYTGFPSLFIRLAGCNLACAFCDTEFDKGLEQARPVEQIMAEILAYPVEQRRLVVITGGEPLRQNIVWLCELLLSSGTETIQLETAGTVWQAELDRMIDSGRLVIVCSPKTPGINPFIAKFCRHWKYIIRFGETGDDGLPMRSVQPGSLGQMQRIYRPWGSGSRPDTWRARDVIWVSPCDEHSAPEANEANVALARDIALKHGYRLNLQIHKLVGVE